MMESSTFWFHRPAANRWNGDVPSVRGNTPGGSSCPASYGVPTSADQWFQRELKIQALLRLQQQPSEPCLCLRGAFGGGRAPDKQSKGRASESSACLPTPCTINPLNTGSSRGPAEMLCPACTAGHSLAPWGFNFFVNGTDSEPWTWEKAELIFTQRNLLGWWPDSKHSPSTKN